MILVVGGFAAGKAEYVRSLGYAKADFSGSVDAECAVLADVQEIVHKELDGDAIAQLADNIATNKQVVICQDVGGGIVPLDADERAWRDRAGSLARELAQRAQSVVRVVCGVPIALKGELPDGLKPVQVVIMRHGETTANELRQYSGTTDVALTERGEREAAEAGVLPEIERVYVSPLQRARRTAEICFPNARQEIIEGFREMNFGDFEGRSAQDMEHDEAYRAWVDSNCVVQCPNGESRADLTERTCAALERIVRDAQLAGEEQVIIVAHGGTIMVPFDAFCDDDRDYFEWHAGNCEGYSARASFIDGNLRLDEPRKFERLDFLAAEESECALSAHPQPSSSFFQNRACEYFPCHEGVAEEDFNCLFCYCPLYALGQECGGNYSYTKSGRKNCKGCALPHQGEQGVRMVAERYDKLADLARREE